MRRGLVVSVSREIIEEERGEEEREEGSLRR